MWFGVLYVAILLVISYANDYLGNEGIYITTGIAGLSDVDAITISISKMSAVSISVITAQNAILLATLANTAAKFAIALWASSKEMRKHVMVGYGFNNGFGVELDGQQTKTGLLTGSPRVANGKVSNDILSINGYYTFAPQNTVQPFILLGAGQSKISGVSTDTVANLGLGTFVKLQDNLSFRAEVRGVYNSDQSNVDTLALVGLQVDFGSKAKPAPIVEPTPVLVPFAPVVVVPADDDKDGIINEQDNCPNTPQGVTVDNVGCPIDTDQDGVADYLDQCADTPLGALVD